MDTGADGSLRNKQQLPVAIAKNPALAIITESHRIIHIYNDSSAVVSVKFHVAIYEALRPDDLAVSYGI